jgi:hypothetical protein
MIHANGDPGLAKASQPYTSNHSAGAEQTAKNAETESHDDRLAKWKGNLDASRCTSVSMTIRIEKKKRKNA